MRVFRQHGLGVATAAALALLLPSAAAADGKPEANVGQTQLLRQLYTSGHARMAKGDPAGAIAVFRVTAEVAPDLPQMQYSLAVAQILADWKKREQALPAIDAALRVEPGHPLYLAAQVLADPKLSQLGGDGALYLTPPGAERLRAAASELERSKSAVNGRYLGAVLGGLQTTGDARLPARLAGFDRMLGQDGRIRLPRWNDSQAFGRLFAIAVPDAQLQPYEPRMLAKLRDGLNSLNRDALRRAQMKGKTPGSRETVSLLPDESRGRDRARRQPLLSEAPRGWMPGPRAGHRHF